MGKTDLIIGKALPFVFFIAVIYIRYVLYGIAGSDFDNFLYWWAEDLRTYGLIAINYDISNYNTPYLILLWFFGKFIPENFMLIKVISTISDVVAAIGIFKIVAHFHPQSPYRLFAAMLYLLIPTVLYNSAAMGQCDGFLGAFAIWAVYFCLKDRLYISWILAGASFAFKMHGIFLSPFILAVALNRKKTFLSGPGLAAVTVFLMSIPTLLIGDSLSRIVGVFLTGADSMFGAKALSWWLPNLHQWFSNDHYDFFRFLGIGIGFVFVVLLAVFGFRSKRFSDEQLMIVAVFTLLILPFILPQMHERYYFQAEVMLFALMFVRFSPARSFALRTVYFSLLQAIVMTTVIVLYFIELFQMHLLFQLLSIGVIFVLVMLVLEYLQYPKYSVINQREGEGERTQGDKTSSL